MFYRVNAIATAVARATMDAANGGGITATVLARELRTGVRTVMRDLDTLRDDLGHDLAYNQSKHSWYYRTLPLSLSAAGQANFV